MLTWLFKKRGAAPAVPVAAARPAAAPQVLAANQAAERTQKRTEKRAQQQQNAQATWAPQLQAALGDDAALLQVALATPVLEIKLAAVQALAAEATLRQAEKAFRSHDRRVHQLARRRLDAAVLQRETGERAAALLATAAALQAQAVVPVNHLVALDRDWQALDAACLDPALQQQFGNLRAALDAGVREQAELRQQAQRQAAEAAQALAEQHQASLAELAASQAAEALAALAAAPLLPSQPPPKPPKPPAAPRPLPDATQRVALEALLQQAEAALADGQLAALGPALQAFDAALAGWPGVPAGDALRQRAAALLAERGRLQDWQRWGGGLARDDLVAQAEVLARATAAAADPALATAPPLDLKPHADAVATLRSRWRELDRLGAAASQSLWQRFDAALQAAYEPVAAQHAALKAARQDNLAARDALLATLDALPDPVVVDGALVDTADAAEAQGQFWKTQLRALDQFHTAWRQLGPVQHTVPAAAREALLAHQRQSLARIEAPLQQARRAAEARREQLIQQAQALAGDAALQFDAAQQVRALQADWQQQARALPLARAVENALWARFKAALDAVFAQRDAARSARDAELALQQQAREARQAQQQAQAQQQRERWQTGCDALLARLAQCELQPEPGAETQASTAQVEGLLLQLEASLDLPACAEQLAARRQLKLLALKAAMEGRAVPAGASQTPTQQLALLLGQRRFTAAHLARLQAVLAALRQAPTGALGVVLPEA